MDDLDRLLKPHHAPRFQRSRNALSAPDSVRVFAMRSTVSLQLRGDNRYATVDLQPIEARALARWLTELADSVTGSQP